MDTSKILDNMGKVILGLGIFIGILEIVVDVMNKAVSFITICNSVKAIFMAFLLWVICKWMKEILENSREMKFALNKLFLDEKDSRLHTKESEITPIKVNLDQEKYLGEKRQRLLNEKKQKRLKERQRRTIGISLGVLVILVLVATYLAKILFYGN